MRTSSRGPSSTTTPGASMLDHQEFPVGLAKQCMHCYMHCTTIRSGLSEALVLVVVWMPQTCCSDVVLAW